MGAKREVPGTLKSLLNWDVTTTDSLVKWIDEKLGPISKWEKKMKYLEISCHGIPWLIFTAIMIFLSTEEHLRHWAVNVFIVLILDIIVVAAIKAVARRRRPLKNKDDMYATILVDKFSFPSGHSTRAMMFAVIFPLKYEMFIFFTLLLMAWSLTICASRVLLQRHHLLDVVAGAFIGLVEAVLFGNLFWMSPEGTNSFVAYFLDETQAGASYDV